MLQGQHGAQGHLEIGDEQSSGPLLQPQQGLYGLIAAVHRIIAVTDIFIRRGDAGFLQRVQITGQALVGSIEVGTAEHQADLPVSQFRQLPDSLVGRMDVVDDNGADFSAQAVDQPVHQQHGDSGGKGSFQVGACGVRGHVDQPVHPAVKQELHGFLLPLRIASAVADDDGIIVLPEDILHGRDD